VAAHIAQTLHKMGNYPNLVRLMRRSEKGGAPLLVVAFSYFFRLEVERDQELANGLFFDGLKQLSASQEIALAGLKQLSASQATAFAQVGAVLNDIGSRLNEIFDKLDEIQGAVVEIQGVVVETHSVVVATNSAVAVPSERGARPLRRANRTALLSAKGAGLECAQDVPIPAPFGAARAGGRPLE